MDNLDFDMWLIAELDMEYKDFQRLSNQEKKRIKDEYREYTTEQGTNGIG